MKNMKLAIISMSVVFFVATIISLVYSLSKGEANAIYLIISDFFSCRIVYNNNYLCV